MEVIDTLPHVERVIYAEPRGFRAYRDDPRFIFWEAFLELGRRHRAEHPGAVEERMGEARPDDLMTPCLHLGYHRASQRGDVGQRQCGVLLQ